MKKLLVLVLFGCTGLIGLTGSVLAGIVGPVDAPYTLNCGQSEMVCIGDDLYEVSFNCDGLTPDTEDLLIDIGPDFDLQVADADPEFNCTIAGSIEQKKTEVKCTEADKGPNKPTGRGNADHSTGDLQVDAEIKLLVTDSGDCPAATL